MSDAYKYKRFGCTIILKILFLFVSAMQVVTFISGGVSKKFRRNLVAKRGRKVGPF